jgi:chromosome segregation ATPase
MATPDEAVANLQRFIGLLASATSATGTVRDHVKEVAHRFGELEGEAEEEGGGLSDDLTEMGSTLQSGEAELLAAIAELGQAAADAGEAAGEVQDKVERVATELEQKADTVENGLEQAGAQLTNEGFEPMDQALDEAKQEMDAESQEEAQAFAELETAMGGFTTEAQAAWSEAEGELDEAATDVTEIETALESEASEGVQAFGTAGSEFETACTTLESDVDLIYDVFDQGVETQGQAWEQAVHSAGQHQATFVTEGRQVRVDQPAEMVEDEALAPLNQEYEAVNTVLDAAATAVGELEPLAEDLVRCQVVVGQIDALMSALAS